MNKLKNNFYFFENSTLSNIKTSDCDETINGKCETTENIDDCVKICAENINCEMGYYLKNNKLCVPLLNNISNTKTFARITDKTIYSELKNEDSTVFVKYGEAEFPPNNANTIFYNDILSLQNIESGLFLNASKETVVFNTNKAKLKIFPFDDIVYDTSERYIPVKHNISYRLGILNTSQYFNIENFNQEKEPLMFKYANINKPLTFGESFYILQNNNVIVYDNDTVFLEPFNKNSLQKNIYFRFVPHIKVYYGKNCDEMNLIDATIDGVKATFNGNILFRNNNCYRNKKINIFWILIPITVLIILYIVNRTKKQKIFNFDYNK